MSKNLALASGGELESEAPEASERPNVGDLVFLYWLKFTAWLMLAILFGTALTLTIQSWPSIVEFGPGFVVSDIWDPVQKQFGALPFLIGTLLTSFLAIGVSVFFSLCVSLFLGEYFHKGWFSNLLRSAFELLGAIPSVVYGFWALFYLVPIVREWEIKFGVVPYGVGVLTASLVLSIMILPYAASVATEVIRMVSRDLKAAAYALGGTRYEVITKVVLPFSRSGIFAGVLLALGRALGETMAVTMVIGNANVIPDNIFSPAQTMASLIANEFTEATERIYLSAIVEVGLVLFVVTLILNAIGRMVIHKMRPSR